MYFVGSELDYWSTGDKELIAEGLGFRGDKGQTCFFTAVDPMSTSMLTPRYELHETRQFPYRLDLCVAQVKRLEFRQTIGTRFLFFVIKRTVEVLYEKDQPSQ